MMYWNYYNNCNKGHHPHRSHRSDRSDGKRNFLDDLVGEQVKINRGGPNAIFGKLLAVKNDYLVVFTREGVVYVKTSHIKSITDLDGSHGTRGSRTGGSRGSHGPHGSHGSHGSRSGGKKDFIKADNFRGVLKALNKKFVQVNWGGPEKVVGFLAEVTQDHILVVSDHKKVEIFIAHIQSIKLENKMRSGKGTSGGTSGGTAGASNASASEQAPKPVVKKALKRRISR
jgi:spore coat protein B